MGKGDTHIHIERGGERERSVLFRSATSLPLPFPPRADFDELRRLSFHGHVPCRAGFRRCIHAYIHSLSFRSFSHSDSDWLSPAIALSRIPRYRASRNRPIFCSELYSARATERKLQCRSLARSIPEETPDADKYIFTNASLRRFYRIVVDIRRAFHATTDTHASRRYTTYVRTYVRVYVCARARREITRGTDNETRM